MRVQVQAFCIVLLLSLFGLGCGGEWETQITQMSESRQVSDLIQPVVGENETTVEINLKGHRQVTVDVPREHVDASNLKEEANKAVTVIAEKFEHAESIRELNIQFVDKVDFGVGSFSQEAPFTFSEEDIQEVTQEKSASQG